MLVIRLSRTGRKKQAAYRIVLAEHKSSVKGKFNEVLGHYAPAEGKKMSFDSERVSYWVSKGARPSDSVAALLTQNGMKGLESFLSPRNKKRAKKNPSEAELAAAAPAPAPAPAPVVEEAVVEEATPVAEEAAPEEVAETPEEAPVEEEVAA